MKNASFHDASGQFVGKERYRRMLDRAYPDIHINLIEETGTFGPDKVHELAAKWKIPTHFMFIASPGDRFPYRIEDLGEVRLII